MKNARQKADEPIELDMGELLGLSQVAKIGPEILPAPMAAKPSLTSNLGRLLSKVGGENL